MKFPSELEFLESFGLEPEEVDASLEYCRYIKYSSMDSTQLDVSFSAVSESFQVVLSCNGNELMRVSSEKVTLIEMRLNSKGKGIHVVFDVCNGKAEAEVTFEPNLHCNWWYLNEH